MNGKGQVCWEVGGKWQSLQSDRASAGAEDTRVLQGGAELRKSHRPFPSLPLFPTKL